MKNNWKLIFAYFGVAASSQMLWLSIAPLATYLNKSFGVTELQFSTLLLCFPAIYLLFSFHAGIFINKYGFKRAVIFGGVLGTIFSGIRIFGDNFVVLAISEVGIAIGQPYILNSISILVTKCFEKDIAPIASGIGVGSQFFGMAFGVGLSPMLLSEYGFGYAMSIFCLTSAICLFIFIIASFSLNSIYEKEEKQLHYKYENKWNHLKAKIFSDKYFFYIVISWFFAYGSFNSLSVWLEEILCKHGISSINSGIAGSFIIIGGFLGTLIIPIFVVRLKLIKQFIIGSCLTAAILVGPICTTSSYIYLWAMCFIFGFIFLPGYSLVLTVLGDLFKDSNLSDATSILMLFGNAGAIFAIGLIPIVHFIGYSWNVAAGLLTILLFMAAILTIFMPALPSVPYTSTRTY